mmetsp:Transcript_18945/g.42087  ORF Transcript_18945/g.42087 Transcript_18945/m.42087 type:complete len:321 (-) Transcript_18945:119-1081(-)
MSDRPKPTAKGPFRAEENDILFRAINNVCAAKDIDPGELASIGDLRKDENKKYRGVWREIADYLPDRTQASVYRRGIRLLNPYKTGAWSQDEVDALQGLFLTYGPKWSKIQAELNRSAESCADKWREVRGRVDGSDVGSVFSSKVRLTWNEEDTEALRVIIRDELGITEENVSFAQMHAKVEAEGIKLPFTAISKKMDGDRTRLNCYERYLLMAGRKRRSKESAGHPHDQPGKKRKEMPGAVPFPQQVADGVTYDTSLDTGTMDAAQAAAEAAAAAAAEAETQAALAAVAAEEAEAATTASNVPSHSVDVPEGLDTVATV